MNKIHTIYSITEHGKVVYIGMTSQNPPTQRWSNHKNRARTLEYARPLHCAMNEISSDHNNFSEYRFSILHTTTDANAAAALEIAEIHAHDTVKNGYNRYVGGGETIKKHSKNDAILDIVKAGYPL